MAETIIKRKIIKKKKPKKGNRKKKTATQKQKQRQKQTVIVNVFTGRGKKGLADKPLSLARQKQKDKVSALNTGGVSRQPLSVGNYNPSSNYFELEQRVQQSVKRSELMNAQVAQAQKRQKEREEAEEKKEYERTRVAERAEERRAEEKTEEVEEPTPTPRLSKNKQMRAKQRSRDTPISLPTEPPSFSQARDAIRASQYEQTKRFDPPTSDFDFHKNTKKDLDPPQRDIQKLIDAQAETPVKPPPPIAEPPPLPPAETPPPSPRSPPPIPREVMGASAEEPSPPPSFPPIQRGRGRQKGYKQLTKPMKDLKAELKSPPYNMTTTQINNFTGGAGWGEAQKVKELAISKGIKVERDFPN